MLRKITCNRTRKLIAIKENYFFIPIRLHSVTISGYILKAHGTSSSLKKKKEKERMKEKEKERKEVKKRRRRKGMERVYVEGKGKGRMRCGRKEERKEKEKKEERRERRIKNREGGIRSVPPPPDAFPSAKLGNNITPIKERLGKNTTPTSRDPVELNQNLQMNPP